MPAFESLTLQEIIERFERLPAATVGDAQERMGVASGLVPMWSGARMVGPAYTVWTRPGDNLFIHNALKEVQTGDVIVANGGGDCSRALIGELIGIRAGKLGVAGFVIDGAVRDVEVLAVSGPPVFARSRTPAGPFKTGPGQLQVPIAVAGVVVHPGDLVVADEDGVVIVRRADSEKVLFEAERIRDDETARRIEYLGVPSVSRPAEGQ